MTHFLRDFSKCWYIFIKVSYFLTRGLTYTLVAAKQNLLIISYFGYFLILFTPKKFISELSRFVYCFLLFSSFSLKKFFIDWEKEYKIRNTNLIISIIKNNNVKKIKAQPKFKNFVTSGYIASKFLTFLKF